MSTFDDAKRFKEISELHAAVKDAMEGSRKALGITQKVYANRLGITLNALENIYYRGFMPDVELARRIIDVHHNNEFKHARRRTVILGHPDVDALMIAMTKPERAEVDAMAKAAGLSAGAFAYIAVKRFMNPEPPTVTIKALAREISRAQCLQQLRANPYLGRVLEMEPAVAAKERQKQTRLVDSELARIEKPGTMILQGLAQPPGQEEVWWTNAEEIDDPSDDID